MAQRLFKRNGTWYGWYFDAEGRRVQRSTKCRDKQAAEAVLREWERHAADPAYAAANSATLERDVPRRRLSSRTTNDEPQEAARVLQSRLLGVP